MSMPKFYHNMNLISLSSGVFEKALSYFRTSASELKEERTMLLEEWLNTEEKFW